MNNTNNPMSFLNKAKSPKSISTSYNFEKHKSFNRAYGIPFQLSLTKYTNWDEKLKEKCWKELTNLIITNYSLKKGTKINNFGTFTFINSNTEAEKILFISQNKFGRDIPIFLINSNFITGIKPGVYEDKKGLTQLSNKIYTINNNIEVVDTNYLKLSKEMNLSKEEYEKIVDEIINDIKDKMKLKIFNVKKMDGLGIFLMRGNIFGMRFDNIINSNYTYNYNLFPTKISLKKNFFKLNKIKKDDENDKDLIYNTDYNSDFLIKSPILSLNNYKLKNKKPTLIKNINITDDKNEDDKSNNILRNFSLLKLQQLKIKKEILLDILIKKELLIQKIKKENNTSYISKDIFINYFLEINDSLDYETVNKIINIYSNNNSEIKIDYDFILSKLFNDINKILQNSELLTINKTIIKNNSNKKKKIDNNKLPNKLPNIKIVNKNNENNKNEKYEKLNLTEEELYKIKKLISTYSAEKYTNLLPYQELINLFKNNGINMNMENFEELFEIKIKNNEQLIDLCECIIKINNKIKRIISKKIIENLNKKNIDRDRDTLYMTNYRNSLTEMGRYHKKLIANSNNTISHLSLTNNEYNINNDNLTGRDNNVININNNEELIIKMINLLREKIFVEQKKKEKITEYFDHLLSYNKNRKDNTINLNEFEKFLKYENFTFSSQEVLLLFNYIDKLQKGHIDRLQFINAIKLIPFPITIVQKYFRANKLSVIDAAFKMEIDIYNIPPEILLNWKIHYITFFSKMKSLNKEFDKNFLTTLFIALTGNINKKLSYKKMFEHFNVYNKSHYTYLNIYENKEKINKTYINLICNEIPFLKLKERLFETDTNSIGKLNFNDFYKAINNLLKGKLAEKNFVHFLRINKLIELNSEIDYINFMRFIDSKYPDDSFIQCLKILTEFLDKECDRDMFIFTIKLNNLNNNSSTNEIISPEKLYYIFKEKNEYLKFETMKKFDYNDDGKISMNDIKNTIIKYYDNHFFDNIQVINENKKKE